MMTQAQLERLFHDADAQLSLLHRLNYAPFGSALTEIERNVNEFCEAGQQLLAESETLQIGIVGQVKAGKSSFLNALFFDGENILPRASTPMTAGLTILEYADSNSFEVEYFSKKDWDFFDKQHKEYKAIEAECRQQDPNMPESILKMEMEQRTSDAVRSAYEMVEACDAAARTKVGAVKDVVSFRSHADLQNVLEQYVGAKGKFTSVVKSLYVKLHDERLKGLRIVDTPGVNDPVVSRENRTRTFLQSCHGVFLLTSSTDFFGKTDVAFLNHRVGAQGIAKVVLLASKFDSVLQDLGADFEMRGVGGLCLSEAATQQFQAFEHRLRELSDTVVEGLRGHLVLDYTSGISYSLAHRPSASWDDMERQVVQQMKRYYPADFATPEQSRESFVSLANIEDIRSNYLHELFLKNKEAIIADKVNAFFAARGKELQILLSKGQRDLEQKLHDLNTKTLADIEAQQALQKKMFSRLSEKFNAEVVRFNSNLQKEARTILQRLSIPSGINIPTEETSASIRHRGAWWGHNNTSMSYSVVNAHELRRALNNVLDQCLRNFNQQWNDIFGELQDQFFQKMTELISQTAQDFGATSAFDDDYYQMLVSRVMDSTGVRAAIDFVNIEQRFKMLANSIAHSEFDPAGYDELSEDSARSRLSSDARAFVSSVDSRVHNEFLLPIKSEVRNAVDDSLRQITAEMDALKGEFATNLNVEAQEYLDQLREELERKTQSLHEIEQFKAAYDQLAILFNS